jgi:transcriptional regulator with XRE-family HTH domain
MGALDNHALFARSLPPAERRVVEEMARRRREEAQRIGARITQLREERHLTQQAAAQRVQVGYRTYQSWEAGDHTPQWHNYERLAAAFGVRVEDIIGAPPKLGPAVPDDLERRLVRIEARLDQLLALLDASEGPLEEVIEEAADLAETMSEGVPRSAGTSRAAGRRGVGARRPPRA